MTRRGISISMVRLSEGLSGNCRVLLKTALMRWIPGGRVTVSSKRPYRSVLISSTVRLSLTMRTGASRTGRVPAVSVPEQVTSAVSGMRAALKSRVVGSARTEK